MAFTMPYSSRKVYDAELMQLDTMLARMGHAAGGAIESAMTALRNGDIAGLVGNALDIGDHLQRGGNLAQVTGHRLLAQKQR